MSFRTSTRNGHVSPVESEPFSNRAKITNFVPASSVDRRSVAGLALLLLFALSLIAIPSVFAFSADQGAAAAAGQPNLTTGGCDDSTQPVPSQSTLCYPYGAAIDPDGNLWVADTSNARVVEFDVSDGAPQSTESAVIGQTSFTGYRNNQGGSPSSSTLYDPQGLAFDSAGDLWVADTGNNRILEFPLVSGVIQTTATEVIGQTGFTVGGCNQFSSSSDSTLCEPTGLAFDSSGNLWVADADNSRVLEFPLVGGVISTTASELIGQTSFAAGSASQACNQAGYGNPPASPTASTLCFPTTLAFDSSGNLWVADSSNSRTLEFPLVSSVIQTTATAVIGQTGFTSDSCNKGSSSPTDTALCSPYGVGFDSSGNLWVTDTANNRVLEFPLVSGAISSTATLVLGQASFTTGTHNGGAYPAPVADGVSGPQSLAFDSPGDLWVVDESNSRVLVYAPPAPVPEFPISYALPALFAAGVVSYLLLRSRLHGGVSLPARQVGRNRV
jgi:sugar lactone lactonase YvrE